MTIQQTPLASALRCATAWNAQVLALGGRLLQSWQWGELKRRYGWIPVRLSSGADDTPRWAAQVLVRPTGPLSIAYVPRGPLAQPGSQPDPAFACALDQLARRHRAIAIIVEPEDDAGAALLAGLPGWRPCPVRLQPARTIRVRVDADDATLLARMKPKTRYNTRLALRRGVRVRLGSLELLAPFYRLLQETAERDGFAIHSAGYHADILRLFGDDAVIVLAEYEGEPAAAALIVRFGPEAIYLTGASATAHQRHMPSYLVQFTAMQWARARGCQVYDLWGIPASDEPPDEADDEHRNVRAGLWGVYRFKLGLGGEVVRYPAPVERVYLPPLVWLWRRLRPLERADA